ncbi:NACHT, LRR and PYD domains-containing protein 1 homolog [Clupea harengus]|uniref:NACHT, LRR and PYD domains-containing protein 1 homolog n=1 Tax=Clupea harengus TaxID=7950 RepID=A0A8M1KCG6_CLUHA|nr:NACHT, LRR and PYD domains-containing protein 1 homolog [Clupea harengus]
MPPVLDNHTLKIDEYKTSICSTYEKVKEYNSRPGENVLLAERYTELLIVETHRNQREREEEIRCRGDDHQQVLKTRASEAYNRITVDQLFKPDDRGDVPKAVILQGDSGYGKSFTAMKIMYDWASGDVFKDLFDLVFHLKCKELNDISEAHSLVDLLSYCPSFTSETAEVLKDSKMKVLFLIDGFDELKFSFEKTSTVPPKDPSTKAPVEATLSALLKGLVLPKCFLLVTTRSTASDKLSDLLSDSQRFTDILGFTEEGVKEYFQRFFKEELLAKKAFDCVRTNETLYTTCFIPVICWITCTVFREQEEGMDITKELETATSIFVHFVSILLKHHCQGLSQPETLLRSLGQLAERGLQEHQVLFDENSLSEAFPDPSQATRYNPFLCKFFLTSTVKQERMYSFMHLSFQEFFAAVHLMMENEEEALKKLQQLLGNYCWVLLYCLQCCPTIRSLELHDCNITAEKLRMLQPALSRCEELGVAKSSLSPESVEQVLSALSRQWSVDNVRLSVTTITGTTAACCLDFMQNTEMCPHLT